MNAHAHVAGLRRLSARANKVHNPTGPLHKGLDSFTVFGRRVIELLRKKHKVPIEKGLREEEFVRIEAALGFAFPPDLRAILQEGVPVGVGFPDWRSGGTRQLQIRLNLPIAGLSYEVAKGRFWCKQWGQRPVDPGKAVGIARAHLRKVPLLVPLYGHCYVPASPDRAGNPVFFVYRSDVSCCGYDLGDFFEREAFGINGCETMPLDFPVNGEEEWGSFRHGRNGMRCLRRDRSVGFYREDDLDHGIDNSDKNRLDPSRNCEEHQSRRNMEAWGRNLDSLAKCSDVVYCDKSYSEWPSRSVSVSDRHSYLGSSGYNSPKFTCDIQLQGKAISDKILAKLPATPAPWPSKIPRWIQFWSDLADSRCNFSCVASPEQLFSSSKVDVDLALRTPISEETGCIVDFCMPKWLMNYLEELASVLRNGGWREDDISDIMEVSTSPLDGEAVFLDSQTILEGLLLKADLMSNSLRKAGWSSEDLAEVFDFDYPIKKPTKKLPPELVERIGKLAEYVAQA